MLCGRVSYETPALRFTYTANLVWLQCRTGEPQLLQYFKMAFLKIKKIDSLVSFGKSGHKCWNTHKRNMKRLFIKVSKNKFPGTAQFKLDIYKCVTLESLNVFVGSLMSFM